MHVTRANKSTDADKVSFRFRRSTSVFMSYSVLLHALVSRYFKIWNLTVEISQCHPFAVRAVARKMHKLAQDHLGQ